VLVSILILINLLVGSSLAGKDKGRDKGKGHQPMCQLLELSGFPGGELDGEWEVLKETKVIKDKRGRMKRKKVNVKKGGAPVYADASESRFLYRYKDGDDHYWAIGDNRDKDNSDIFMKRREELDRKVICGDEEEERCNFEPGKRGVTGDEQVTCLGENAGKHKEEANLDQEARARNRRRCRRNPNHPLCRQNEVSAGASASAMMQGDAVTEESASGSVSGDLMLMAAGAAVGALLVAVAVAVVVAMRKRKSAKRTEMEMTEAVHVPDTSVMTPDATEKKAEGDEEAVTVHSSHVAEVTVSVSMDDEAVQVDA